MTMARSSTPNPPTPNSQRGECSHWALGCWALGVIGAALIVVSQPLAAAGRLVTFRAADGRMLTGLFMEAGARPAPAVILVPMLGRSKDDWEGVAQRLADANINALAIDLPARSLPADPAQLRAWHEDILAASAFLAGRPADVTPGAVGVAGASLGANLAVVAAAADASVRSIALVSPSLDYRGVRIDASLRQYGARPALLMASLHDPYAARSVRELAQDPPGPREVRWSSVAAHGTSLLSRDPDLVRSLVEWFQQTLGVK
jgi:dienelactone hydrolase